MELKKEFMLSDTSSNSHSKPFTQKQVDSMKKKFISIRATKRILAPYVKARKKPVEAPVENKHFSFYIQKKPSILMKVMTKWSLAADLLAVMTETVQVLGEITESTSAMVYMVDDTLGEIYQVIESYDNSNTHSNRRMTEKPRISYKIELSTTVASHVAYTKEIIKLDDLLEDIRFPDGLGNNEVTVKSVLCVPILSPDDECLAVFELYRNMDQDVYTDGELSIVILMSSWIGSTIYHNQQLVTLRKQHELTGYLLQLTECYFDDAKLLDKLISEIVNFAKIALDAENAMFYVLKPLENDQEIYVDEYADRPFSENLSKTKNVEVFEGGTAHGKADLVNIISNKHSILNIKHSTNDYRIRREQKKIKFKIRCLIATSIKCNDQVLGVMELFNKRDGPFFSKSDEILLKTFSDYCGLVLKFAHEYERDRKTDKLNQVYKNMLNLNLIGCIHDSLFVISQMESPGIPERFNQFDFYLPEAYDMYSPQLIMYMFDSLNPLMFKDKTSQVQFVLAIKKAYSDLPYHNFQQGFHSCHCMYNLLARCTFFDTIEITALLLSSYCHGIDHNGLTNSFLKMSDHPLASLYEDHYLENHYFFVTQLITKHLDVFSHMAKVDYELLIYRIKNIIISSNSAICLQSIRQLSQAYRRSDFDLFKLDHRLLLQSVLMCMAKFSNFCKPFHITKRIVDRMYDEFYGQGNKIRNMGFSPLSIYDSTKNSVIAQDQINLMTVLVLPCAQTVSKFVPACDTIYRNGLRVRDAWEEIWQTQGQKLWSIDESIPRTKKY